MTDLEITRLCAEAIGTTVVDQLGMVMFPNMQFETARYDPLHDDAQVMALVKFLVRHNDNERLMITNHVISYEHRGFLYQQFGAFSTDHLNRAICECVAKMQAAKAQS